MSATYPKPETPLPWSLATNFSDYDHHYIVRAANAFPHLVAALEWAATVIRPDTDLHNDITAALAIARGETTP